MGCACRRWQGKARRPTNRPTEERMAVEAQGIVAWQEHAAVAPEPLIVDEPGPGEVLVRVQASGVCHTDLHIRNGAIGTLPILLGHEGAGVVEAVGPGVTTPQVGDYVILAWRAPCGTCRFCRIGQPTGTTRCPPGHE